MRNRTRFLLLAALGLAAFGAALVIYFGFPGQPEYRGRKLSQWLETYGSYHWSQPPVAPEERDEALQQMGTNAVPFLVKWLEYEPPAWKIKAWEIAGQVLKKPLASTLKDRQAKRRGNIVSAFQALGPEGKGAIGKLGRVMNYSRNERHSIAAALALAAIGRDALPTLTEGLTNQSSAVRSI